MKPQPRGEDRAEVRYRALPWGSTPGRNRRGQAARSRELEVFRDGAEATVQDRGVSSPGRPAQERTPGPRVKVGIAAAPARPQRFCGSGSTGGLPARALPSARHPPSPSGLRARPAGEGTGRGSSGAYLRAPRAPRRAPGRRRAGQGGEPRAAPSRLGGPAPSARSRRPPSYLHGPSPPAALTGSLARGRRPQPARGLDWGGESPLQPAAVAPHQRSSSL